MDRPVVLVSNRGPVSFSVDDHEGLTARRGAGGLVSGLAPLAAELELTWVAAALGDGDRLAAARGPVDAEGFRVRLLALDPHDFRLAYDVVCNATLWFVYHALFDLARQPVLDSEFDAAWAAFRRYNQAFADAVVTEAPRDAVVLLQDYHLSLTARPIAEARPDLACVHFSHTPLAPPPLLGVLPDAVATELLAGLAANRGCGFHTRGWADEFEASCAAYGIEAPTTFVAPLGSDRAALETVAHSAAAEAEVAWLAEVTGGRLIIGRVDRVEPSKNVLRSFQAYAELLSSRPDLRGRVSFVAVLYPSRQGLAPYRTYSDDVTALAEAVNDRFATPDWTPVVLDTSDNYPRSLAVLRRSDVIVVNPIRDGLNLVASEAALLNERSAPVVLSDRAGIAEQLGHLTDLVNPFDISQTAAALAAALDRPEQQRRRRARELRTLAGARTPRHWFDDQLAAVSD